MGGGQARGELEQERVGSRRGEQQERGKQARWAAGPRTAAGRRGEQARGQQATGAAGEGGSSGRECGIIPPDLPPLVPSSHLARASRKCFATCTGQQVWKGVNDKS